MKRKVEVKPFVEEDDVIKWVAGLRSCAKLERDSADKMKRGIWPGNWRAQIGMAKLLERLANLTDPRKRSKRREVIEEKPRISDGKISLIPRVCL